MALAHVGDTAVLFAVRGDNGTFGEAGQGGKNIVNGDGTNDRQHNTPTRSPQSYLTRSVSDDSIAGIIDGLLDYVP